MTAESGPVLIKARSTAEVFPKEAAVQNDRQISPNSPKKSISFESTPVPFEWGRKYMLSVGRCPRVMMMAEQFTALAHNTIADFDGLVTGLPSTTSLEVVVLMPFWALSAFV